MESAPLDLMRPSGPRRRGRKFHNGPRFGLRRMAPELRDGREEGLAEDRAALEAVAPILADRRAALPALAAGGGLVRLDDDQFRILQLVPPRLPDEEEREVVGPGLEFQERELPAREEFVDAFQEVARV